MIQVWVMEKVVEEIYTTFDSATTALEASGRCCCYSNSVCG